MQKEESKGEDEEAGEREGTCCINFVVVVLVVFGNAAFLLTLTH